MDLTSDSSNIKNARVYGAQGDGTTVDTPAVEAAIQACTKLGGGIVYFPAGTYVCGTIHLKDNISLFISPGATILFSSSEDDFDEGEILPYETHADNETSYFHFSLIQAIEVAHIAIEGGGSIVNRHYNRGGPKPIAIKSCQNVTIRDITIENGPNYSISLMDTDFATIDNVTILNGLADGIDFDNCRFGRVANSHIDSSDDAICLKTSPALGHISSTENIVVTNCSIATSANCLKLGTESSGDFKYIAFTNCSCNAKVFARPPNSAIALESVDGAHITGVAISNITMVNVRCPIFLRLGNRGRAQIVPTAGSLENVSISNIVATGASVPCIVAGIPGAFIRHVNIADVIVEYQAPREADKDSRNFPPAENALQVPEAEGRYPEASMFGLLPIWGFYGRHAQDLTLRNLHFRISPPDTRSGLVLDDVQAVVVDGMALNEITVVNSGELGEITRDPAILCNDVADAAIHGCHITYPTSPIIRVTGSATRSIKFLNNSIVPRPEVDTDASIPPGEIVFK